MADDPAAPLAFHPAISDRAGFSWPTKTRFSAFAPIRAGPLGKRALDLSREPKTLLHAACAEYEYGTPRYTLTIADGRLYARVGTPVTNPPQPLQPRATARAAAASSGWTFTPKANSLWRADAEEGWAFDGAPVVAGGRLFVAMRHADIRPQAHVACFDTTTGRMRWRRFICAAGNAGPRGPGGMHAQSAHAGRRHDLRKHESRRAVAALAADSGRINWLSLYPRAHGGNLARMDRLTGAAI